MTNIEVMYRSQNECWATPKDVFDKYDAIYHFETKGYECCVLGACSCLSGCPYRGMNGDLIGEECWRKAREDVLDLMIRQKAEIERLEDLVYSAENEAANVRDLYFEEKSERGEEK